MFDYKGKRKNTFIEILDSESEYIPIGSPDANLFVSAEELPEELPILTVRDSILFPGMIIPITVGRSKSLKLINDAYKKNNFIGVVSQIDPTVEDPGFDDLYKVGTIAVILKALEMPGGNTTIIIQGRMRFELLKFTQTEPYFKAKVQLFERETSESEDKDMNALLDLLKETAKQIVDKSPHLSKDAAFPIKNAKDVDILIGLTLSGLELGSLEEKQELLETMGVKKRALKLHAILTHELQMLDLKNQIHSKVKSDIEQQQRNFLLNQQLKTIQEELGGTPNEIDIKELREKAAKKKWNDQVAQVFERELNKFQRMNPQAADYAIQHNYLEYLVDLPWNAFTKDNFNIKNAQKVLDKDHFGLEKVKDRILEHLSVLKIKKDMKAPILCLVGPPGVGKTSLGKSIAHALNRKYIRMSLGGLRDESELRGHRKTYIGAMPGRIIQNLRKVQSSNPVFVLDEIDKVSGHNISGDPQAALLEILDPEQNNAFYDNFLEMDYDLSKILFIATANTMSTIHPALRDRMEVIDLNSYLVEEKIEIAKHHLIPKQISEHGLKPKDVLFSDKIIQEIITSYTREAGVRMLERQIARLIRNRVRLIASGETYNKKIESKDLKKILGIGNYQREEDVIPDVPGVVTGLAWTPIGGEILFIEVSLSKGKGELKLTGNLGDVMKESATIAYEFLKAHASNFAINPDIFSHWNVHIHVPEGATPKDGPSAGITMLTALISVFTQRKVKPRIAMTGEITLRGKLLPVGGIKEKILAAKRSNVTDIMLSSANKRDFDEISEAYIKGVNFHFFEHMIDVVDFVLEKEKVSTAIDFEIPKENYTKN
ncbi:MAG: endopeptidase La [Lentimicrobiaceae bacterium]|nr:endopeptidase La [Lentimicrobiaceae bacterium]